MNTAERLSLHEARRVQERLHNAESPEEELDIIQEELDALRHAAIDATEAERLAWEYLVTDCIKTATERERESPEALRYARAMLKSFLHPELIAKAREHIANERRKKP